MMKKASNSFLDALYVIAACLCVVTLAVPASAQDNLFSGASSTDYNDPTNWALGVVPSGGETAVIGDAGALNPAIADLSADAPTPLFEFKVGRGANGNGTMNHTAGAIVTDNWALVGDGGGADMPAMGTYNLSGTGSVEAGANGDGSLGVGAGGGHGNFHITSADASVLSDGYSIGVGDDSIGIFTQSAGTVTARTWMNVGQEGAANGTYNMSGGNLMTPELSVGENGPSTGIFNASESASLSLGNVRIGRNDGSTGTLNLTGSKVSFDADLFSVASSDGGLSLDSTAPSTSSPTAGASARLTSWAT